MRLLLEVIVAAALIALSWDKSFKQWASEVPVIGSQFSAEPPAKSKVKVFPDPAPIIQDRPSPTPPPGPESPSH
jgi:hypothetical protein